MFYETWGLARLISISSPCGDTAAARPTYFSFAQQRSPRTNERVVNSSSHLIKHRFRNVYGFWVSKVKEPLERLNWKQESTQSGHKIVSSQKIKLTWGNPRRCLHLCYFYQGKKQIKKRGKSCWKNAPATWKALQLLALPSQSWTCLFNILWSCAKKCGTPKTLGPAQANEVVLMAKLSPENVLQSHSLAYPRAFLSISQSFSSLAHPAPNTEWMLLKITSAPEPRWGRWWNFRHSSSADTDIRHASSY